MYSKGIVVGFLTKDPESRTVNDKLVCTFTVAANNSKTDVCFMSVEVWEKKAEFVMQFFKKGKPIIAEGILKQSIWEKDGKKMSRHYILADKVAFVAGQPKDEEPMLNETKRIDDELPF